MIKYLKQKLIRTPFYRTSLEIQGFIVSNAWRFYSKHRIQRNSTIYVISPHKTGTTYITSSFDNGFSRHEPYQFISWKKLSSDFNENFVRRLNFLDLKLEASGFLSFLVSQLAENPITSELNYVCILRKPSSWATSLINYNHHEIDSVIQPNYSWTNELFWKKHLGVNLSDFFNLSEEEKYQTGEKLINFYIDFTLNTRRLKNVQYVWINDLKDFTLELGSLINVDVASQEKIYRRKGKGNKYVHKNEERDQEYLEIVDKYLIDKTFKS